MDVLSRAEPVAFTGNPLNRADHLRADAEALARLASGEDCPPPRLLRLSGIDPVLDDAGALAWTGLAPSAGADSELIFLGLDQAGAGCFVPVPEPGSASTAPAGPRLWQAMAGLGAEELALYGTARAQAGWHARHRFCAQCGAPTRLARGGWQRDCTSATCGAQHFPRTDPVAIMLVEHEGDLLLGRQPRFPAGRYSALAGFIEPGESIEEAVAREVFEEVGLRVGEVRYTASQPWPFPSSLMIGCHATALSRELTIDRAELDDARWFTRAEVAEAMAARERGEAGRAFEAPPKHAVAWHLLNRWLHD